MLVGCGVPTATLLYEDRQASIEPAKTEDGQLWLQLTDLHRATGWEVKPEGVCQGDICVPVPEARRSALLGSGETTFNLTEFASRIEQPYAHDDAAGVWLFGPAGWEWRSRNQASRQAPDFTLPDIAGKPFTLSRLLGNKVFLLFWATW